MGTLWKASLPVLMLVLLTSCTVVSANRVFPKLAWYWSKDAKMQRESDALERTNNAARPTAN